MGFFTNKIVTKPISLEDAVKKEQPKVRSLDEILASVKQTKTAAAAPQAEVKTAAVEAPKVVEAAKVITEIKVSDEFKKEALTRVPIPGVKDDTWKMTPGESGQAMDAAKAVGKSPFAPGALNEISTIKPGRGQGAKQVINPDIRQKMKAPVSPLSTQRPAPAPIPAPVASSKHVLKLASKIDFRNWEAQAVVDAWKQHGTVEACVKNVGKDASDPKTYCALLRVAANEATKVVKSASAKKEEKTASPIYKKIAKLTSNEQSFLREFFSKIYGKDYVEALLSDY